MTAPRFELTCQRQKISRLPTEPPGRPAQNTILLIVLKSYFEVFAYLVGQGEVRGA